MQSNISKIYDDTDRYQTPVQDYDTTDEYDYQDNIDNDYSDDDFVYDDTEDAHEFPTGASEQRHVLRLLLIALVVILVLAVLFFGIIPYVDALSQPIAPPLPPAVQTQLDYQAALIFTSAGLLLPYVIFLYLYSFPIIGQDL